MNDTAYEYLVVIGTLGTAIATFLLALFAARAFRASVAQLKLLSADSARQTRPYVYVDVLPGLHGHGFWDLKIKNVGRSSARDIVVDAGALKPKDKADHISEPLRTFLSKPFMLPPSTHRRVMWRMEADEKFDRTVAGVDQKCTIKVVYSDDQGQIFDESFDVDLSAYGIVTPLPTQGNETVNTSKSAEHTLQDINKAVRALNVHVGYLRE